MKRRDFLLRAAGTVTAMSMGRVLNASAQADTDPYIAEAREILSRVPAVDLHTHPGMFALKDIPNSLNPRRYFGDARVAERIAQMRRGQLGCAFVATVSDAPILRPPTRPGETFEGRDWKEGEAWREYQRQSAVLDWLVSEHDLEKSYDGVRHQGSTLIRPNCRNV